MRQVISGIIFSIISTISFAGDCNKTVMGGGCSAQVEAGVSPHMQTQNPLNAVTKTKEQAAKPAVKTAVPAKAVNVSNANAQKPQI
ncbi:MAG: hypothetical protein VW548_01835 [Methylotenera sp.]